MSKVMDLSFTNLNNSNNNDDDNNGNNSNTNGNNYDRDNENNIMINNNNNDFDCNCSRKKCSFVKEGLIKLLFFLRFNRTCLKPRKNYAVAS